MNFSRFVTPLLAASLALSAAGLARADGDSEPLPSNAPTDPYELSAWCYGAMSEYLAIYDRVKPDIRDIDKLFGSSVKDEKEPYQSDVAAARQELKVLGGAVEAAERASPQVISDRGTQAVKAGRSIWSPAEQGSHREQARAWMSWALPDRCDSTARELATKSALLGQVLKYNAPSAADPAPAAAPAPAPDQPQAPGKP
jgi:hypothetical protein